MIFSFAQGQKWDLKALHTKKTIRPQNDHFGLWSTLFPVFDGHNSLFFFLLFFFPRLVRYSSHNNKPHPKFLSTDFLFTCLISKRRVPVLKSNCTCTRPHVRKNKNFCTALSIIFHTCFCAGCICFKLGPERLKTCLNSQ